MMTNFGEMTLNEFCSVLSSEKPTPGGGSASGVALSQAGALACMVANLTIGKDRYSSGWEAAEIALIVGNKAVEMGYYNRPRGCTQRDIAREMNVKQATISEHLQSAESKIINSLSTS